jgi:hypothetical protein
VSRENVDMARRLWEGIVEASNPTRRGGTFRDGRVVRWRAYFDKEQALEAVGLPG